MKNFGIHLVLLPSLLTLATGKLNIFNKNSLIVNGFYFHLLFVQRRLKYFANVQNVIKTTSFNKKKF